ncbi:hypothetical protein [Pseudomonas xanthosomatis]|uniref:hypothetical protein n=1 Tax=Pseudomonas xanthosomatis TaxID=2842356 RepID=UPI0035117BE3
MKNQIRMITGIGTPIIHSSIERMAFLLVVCLTLIAALPMPFVSKNDTHENQRVGKTRPCKTRDWPRPRRVFCNARDLPDLKAALYL